MQDEDDLQSLKSSESKTKRSNEWFQKILQRSMKFMQSDDNKKYLQVFFIDPVLNHILERIFPYVLILSVLFTVLTCMVAATLAIVFMRVPQVLSSMQK